MTSLRTAFALAVLCTVPAAVAVRSGWAAVPGAPEVELQLGSMQMERTRVVVWLRWRGRHPLVP